MCLAHAYLFVLILSSMQCRHSASWAWCACTLSILHPRLAESDWSPRKADHTSSSICRLWSKLLNYFKACGQLSGCSSVLATLSRKGRLSHGRLSFGLLYSYYSICHWASLTNTYFFFLSALLISELHNHNGNIDCNGVDTTIPALGNKQTWLVCLLKVKS